MPLITCKDLSLGYDGKEILHGLGFEVCAGEYLCIVGENGSGKSTLMKTLLGLNQPFSGSVVLGEGLKKNEIGYLPQQTQIQRDFPASVLEIVLSGFCGVMGVKPFYTPAQKSAAVRNIERMGIPHLKNRCYRELSGGQQQRALLARALCATGKIILLDEPVSGLDSKATAEMYDIIERLNREDKITVIMISHDITAALKYATNILHIGGEIFFGKKEEYMESSVFSNSFGGEKV
ncbi:MAG: metal ABC transporter ATP-binding protein [Clostridia bacterium]|nr:metal ABC transporter ATP-binding protein [Clostridia bacterium]